MRVYQRELAITEEISLLFYMLRVVLALVVVVVSAFLFTRYAKTKGWVQRNAHVEIVTSLPLGKDVFFVLRCGPDVFALASGAAGTRLIGRWKYEDWLEWEEKERKRKELGVEN